MGYAERWNRRLSKSQRFDRKLAALAAQFTSVAQLEAWMALEPDDDNRQLVGAELRKRLTDG